MDFFSHQERARRQTTRLVVLFCLAVVGIIAAIYTVLILVFAVAEQGSGQLSWWNPELFAFATAGTLLVVGLGSLYKTQQLRAGGSVIAQLLGGRQVLPNTTDPQEKTLINVVEEISVASGVPVPEVYLLDGEAGINAFAAGFTPGDAVIGVTRGCLEQLNRDELQGVIAHEFSHIFNGDMRLNLRLIGVLHGILCVGLAGYVILRSGTGFRHRGGKGSAAGGVLALGVALIAIGFIGVALISAPSLGDGASQALGVSLVVAATLCYGVAINIANPLQARYGPLAVMRTMLSMATLFVIPVLIWGLMDDNHPSLHTVWPVFVLGVAGTGFAYWMMASLVGRVGSVRASVLTYLIPVVALVLGVVIRSDRVSPIAVVGTALVIVGAVTASRSSAGPSQS